MPDYEDGQRIENQSEVETLHLRTRALLLLGGEGDQVPL